MYKALIAIGTRPELIKVAPIIHEMEKRGLRSQIIVVNTGQHKELMDNTFRFFGIDADFNLGFMVAGQSLNDLTARALIQFQELLTQLIMNDERPEMILAQGDTATAFAAAITAFHNRIPFAHIEAGLRTNNLENPFPEEYYRKVISPLALIHFTPTRSACNNLLKEGICPDKIMLTGNTVVDALNYIQEKLISNVNLNDKFPFSDSNWKKNLVLITCHRRENFGSNILHIIKAVESLATANPENAFLWLRHPNPAVKNALDLSGLSAMPNVSIINPMDYFDLIRIMPFVKIIITDSGGLQEEAPSFKIPVIILRETTERMESVENGYALLCGANIEKIKTAFNFFMNDAVNISHNPYGDGKASEKIGEFMEGFLDMKAKIELKPQSNEQKSVKNV
jgi:UDP-N-acetylglucosamine 2-epimerase (non-hydrolysing)